jgi:tetratricopeptide (TPR) repeat protein
MLLSGTLVLAMSLQAQPQAPPTADALGQAYYFFLQGRAFEDQNDLGSAIGSFRQALDLLPGSAEIHVELASLFAQQGQLPDAKTEAQAALAIDPDSHEAHRILGWVDLSTLDTLPPAAAAPVVTDAITHLERAMTGGAVDSSLRLALGQLYIRQKDSAKAIATLEPLVADDADNPPALRMLAQAYLMGGRTADEQKTLKALDDATPDSVELRVRQISAIEEAGQWSTAVQAWGDLLGRDPSTAIYQPRYAIALANAGRVPDAREVLSIITTERPQDISAWYLSAQIAARADDPAGAEAAAQKITAIDPKDARGPLSVAAAAIARKNYRGVITALTPRIATATDDDVQNGMYAQMVSTTYDAYSQLKDQKKGLGVLETAVKRAPEDEDLQYRLGGAYEENKQYDQAEAVFRKLIAAEPNFSGALNYLGYMLADRGKKLPEAVEFINRALAIEKDNPAYLDSLGWAYYRMGEFDKAKDPLEKAAAALPKASVIQEHLGDVYVSLKRYGDAAAAFDRALSGDRDEIDASAVTRKRDQARREAK